MDFRRQQLLAVAWQRERAAVRHVSQEDGVEAFGAAACWYQYFSIEGVFRGRFIMIRAAPMPSQWRGWNSVDATLNSSGFAGESARDFSACE
jgi:hypothetical protein